MLLKVVRARNDTGLERIAPVRRRLDFATRLTKGLIALGRLDGAAV
jgi:hypothetical protein